MVDPYELIPTARKRGSKRPIGWVQFAPGMNTKRRIMTEGYLLQRMPRTNTISANQNYVERVLSNKRTPEQNRQAVLQFIQKHPEKFIPVYEDPEDPVLYDWARFKNAGAKRGWIQWIKSTYFGQE